MEEVEVATATSTSDQDEEASFEHSWELSAEEDAARQDGKQRESEAKDADVLSSIENLTAILAAEDSSSISLSLPKSFDEPLLDAMFQARPAPQPTIPPNLDMPMRAAMYAELEPAEVLQRLVVVDSERLALQKKLQSESMRWQHELQILKQKAQQERQRHQAVETALRNDLDSVRQRLQEKMEHMADIHISDALYAELKQVDPRHHTIKERIQIEVFEKIAPIRKELETTRIKLQDVQRTLEATTQHNEVLVAESARARRLAGVREEGLNMELSAAQQRCKDLAALVEAEAAKAKVNAEKAQQFDELHRNFTQGQRELEETKELLHKQTDAVNRLTASERELQAQVADLERSSQLLKLDKEYLQRELHLATGRIDQLERAQNELDRDYKETKKQKERLMEQILELQTTTKVSYDLHINSEFERLRTESQQQLELIKQHHREVLERETRVLREAKDEACRQAEELRKQLIQVENSRQELTLRLAKIESEQDGRVAELQSEVKVKTFELNQIKSTLETKLARVRQYEVELDMANEELNIHKRQFLILEQESSAEIRSLTSALAAASEKLQAYESLEAEIDKSIVRMGKENNPAALKTTATTVQWSVHNLPSIAQRRTQQALHLAQQLHQKEAEVSECNQRLRRLQLALEEAYNKQSLAEKALERSHHPTQYLIQQLRTVEEDNLSLQRELEHAQTQLAEMSKELQRSRAAAAQAEEKLQQLVRSRVELTELKAYFQQLLEQESMEEARAQQFAALAAIPDHDVQEEEDGDDLYEPMPEPVSAKSAQSNPRREEKHDAAMPFLETLQTALQRAEEERHVADLSADMAQLQDADAEAAPVSGRFYEEDDDDDLGDEVLSKLSVHRGSDAAASSGKQWHVAVLETK